MLFAGQSQVKYNSVSMSIVAAKSAPLMTSSLPQLENILENLIRSLYLRQRVIYTVLRFEALCPIFLAFLFDAKLLLPRTIFWMKWCVVHFISLTQAHHWLPSLLLLHVLLRSVYELVQSITAFFTPTYSSRRVRRSLSDLANFLCPGETDSSFSCSFYSASIDAVGAESTMKRDTESCASPATLTFPGLFHRFDRFGLCEDLFHFGCLRCGESKQTAAILDRWMWRQESCSWTRAGSRNSNYTVPPHADARFTCTGTTTTRSLDNDR